MSDEKTTLFTTTFGCLTDVMAQSTQTRSMQQSRGGGGGGAVCLAWGPDPPGKSQKYRYCKQYWYGSHKNHKATKPAFDVGQSPACQRNAISLSFSWWADDGPLSGILPTSSTKKICCQRRTLSDKTFWFHKLGLLYSILCVLMTLKCVD